jgi:cytochrome c556
MHHRSKHHDLGALLRRSLLTAALAMLPVAIAALPAAATASEGAIDYRQNVLKAAGGHLQATAEILRQNVPHQDHVRMHADAIAALSAIADTLWPAGSEGGNTLPAAWQRPEDFAQRASDFQLAATGFAAAVEAGEGVMPAFQRLGQACKSCHDNYRAK